ncbi:hypothetical protein SAMN04487989_1011170 [Bizionia echini]|uniref:Uncharacterized protein n=1 Tax=Bizionia echini TaxID=649333 RepID=A0A1I4ZXU2_9FLAO|nr:hypothetical protein [Bizionia echini]SFN54996.1 hypothetical protein SAMN04487989_1011170 [Bizionia echini]
MVPNKFENNIKKTLEERQISPSSNAWNQLSNVLDEQDKKSSRKYIWLIGIAASVVGLLFIVNTFQPFKDIEKATKPTVVETTSKNKLKIDSTSKTLNAVANSEDENKNLINDLASDSLQKKQTIKRKNRAASRFAMVNKDKVSQSHTNSMQDFKNGSENERQTANTTPQNSILNNALTDVVDASDINLEVDALLKQATSKVSSVSGSDEKKYTINPKHLLEDVEMDLDKSFRDKVFETIKTNFTIVKTAVADRNN